MYFEDEITTIEMLVTSKDLSEFVDKETYRNAVQKKVQTTVKKIAKLKAELSSKKKEIDKLLSAQRTHQTQLNNSKAEQANLLALNVQQQSDFQQKIIDNQARIVSLQAEQNAANAGLFGSSVPRVVGGGGYQWGNASFLHVGVRDPRSGEYDC